MITEQTPSRVDLSYLGILPGAEMHHQEDIPVLVEEAVKHGEGLLTPEGALAIDTGQFTGRAPNDRFIVDDEITHNAVWWGENNQPISASVFDRLFEHMGNYLSGKRLYVRDGMACADPEYRLRLRVITETAYQDIFAHNMFIRTERTKVNEQAPEWSVLVAPGFFADPEKDGVPHKNFVIINFTRKVILIAGTGYTGEIKKGIFSVLNFILPHQRKVLSMHCAANTDDHGETALFFGLSGTGKTTLSSDADRYLIGDDEHGWGREGIFNVEGGCYAKCVNLDAAKEPEIYKAIRFGALLENIEFFPGTRKPDYTNTAKTENTRVAYPLEHIERSVPTGRGNAPKHIFFLTADAFGVLPPVSSLTPAQAMYHFISGYTAKVAGTEVGITEPKMVFSACFGQAFIPLHPSVYAELLGDKLKAGAVKVWLINTGWIAGPYGIGRRIKLAYTRAIIRAVLKGELDDCHYKKHPVFGLSYPTTCPSVPDAILDPVQTWSDQEAYYSQANKLACAFVENFRKFEADVNPEVLQGAPPLKERVES